MALKAGTVGIDPKYVDKDGRPLYDNSYLKELLRKEGIITLFTKEGNPITIDNAVAGRVYDLAVTMSPKQAGTGTPSPTNVREISGYTGLTITVNGTDIERDFDTTVYGGYDDVTGEGATSSWEIVDLGNLTWTNLYTDRFYSNELTPRKANSNALCSCFAKNPTEVTSIDGLTADMTFAFQNTNDFRIIIRDSSYTDADAFKTAMSGMKLVYEVATPTSIPLTAQNISLNTGSNTISSDTGTTIDLKYLGTLVSGGANGRSLNRSLSLNREVIDSGARKGSEEEPGEIKEEVKEEIKEEVPEEKPVTTKKSTKKTSTK